MKLPRSWRAIVVPVLIVMMATPVMLTQFPSIAQGQAGVQSQAGQSASVSPAGIYTPQWSSTPPQPNAAQIAAAQAEQARIEKAWASRPLPATPPNLAGPRAGTETIADSRAQAPGTFTIFRNTAPNGSPAGFRSNVAEPAIAQNGKFVYYTHNWYVARSTNGGTTWAFISPFADMSFFCCDQDTLFDPARNQIIWYRQGLYGTPAGRNTIRIQRSIDGGATWCTYNLTPANLGYPTGQWFDYPHLAVSNDYLYVTSNMFTAAGAFLRMVLMRLSLDQMRSCITVGITFWTRTTGWSWTPAQGATDRMYVGDHESPGATMRVFWNDEANTTLSSALIDQPNFTPTNRNATCASLGGGNPCLRADMRILRGWILRNAATNTIQVGFFWNVKEGAGFTKPYVDSVLINANTNTIVAGAAGRPFIWNGTIAFFYASASPNARGHLGINVSAFQSSVFPRLYVGIDDDFNGAPPGWEIALVATGTGAALGNVWGDYSRVVPFRPSGLSWVSSGFVSTGSSNNTSLRATWFGRGRDQDDFNYWNNK
ncbi:MAG TPA: hypothetical protein VGK88_11365 [bacterium]